MHGLVAANTESGPVLDYGRDDDRVGAALLQRQLNKIEPDVHCVRHQGQVQVPVLVTFQQ